MDTTTVDDTREDGWEDYEEPDHTSLPVRSRRRFLNGTTALLISLITAAGGFYAGVRVEKNQATTSAFGGGAGATGGGAFASRLRSLFGSGSGSGSTAGSAGAASPAGGASSSGSGAVSPAGAAGGLPGAGFPGAGGFAARFGGGSAGTVASINGNTLVLSEASGNTVKVALGKVTKVSKSQSVSRHAIRPGDTISVQGVTKSNGTITATSVSDSGNTSSSTGSSASSASAGGGGGGLSSLFRSGG